MAVMPAARRWYSILFIQVLIAIAIGIAIGYFWPKTGAALKPLGDGFIQLIKMMIAPVIFCTIVHGIASMRDLTKVGRVGVKALVYFELVSTLALAIGLLVGEIAHPGAGFNIDPASLDPRAVSGYITRAKEEGIVSHILAIIPNTFVDAFAKGDLLQEIALGECVDEGIRNDREDVRDDALFLRARDVARDRLRVEARRIDVEPGARMRDLPDQQPDPER